MNVYAAADSSQLSRVVASFPERVYVPDNLAGTADVIDPATYKVIAHFRVGRSPQHITPSWDLQHLYVNNTAGNSLTVINPRTCKPTGTIPIADPYNLYFTTNGAWPSSYQNGSGGWTFGMLAHVTSSRACRSRGAELIT